MPNNDWLNCSSIVQLCHGCHFYEGHDGFWRLYGPDGKFIRLRLDSEHGVQLKEIVHGMRPVGNVLAGAASPRPICQALDSMRQHNLLCFPNYSSNLARPGRRVAVLGINSIAAEVSRILTTAGVDLPEPGLEHADMDEDCDVLANVDLLVACAGWLPDTRWQWLDRACATRGIPWHMCYFEGTRVYLGPIFLPGSTAGYSDTRARRLAAAVLPAELEAYWAYLDVGDDLPEISWPDPGVTSVIAGMLVADVLAVLASKPALSAGFQIEFDPAQLTVVHHPVLPLPREVMTRDRKFLDPTCDHD